MFTFKFRRKMFMGRAAEVQFLAETGIILLVIMVRPVLGSPSLRSNSTQNFRNFHQEMVYKMNKN